MNKGVVYYPFWLEKNQTCLDKIMREPPQYIEYLM